MKSYLEIINEYKKRKCWGLSTIMSIYDCDKERIKLYEVIEDYVIKLCDLIKMNRYGNPTIKHFGQDEKVKGYSFMQLIETSSITGHFSEASNNAYIDIFSCKLYDPFSATEFTREYFQGDSVDMHVIFRK